MDERLTKARTEKKELSVKRFFLFLVSAPLLIFMVTFYFSNCEIYLPTILSTLLVALFSSISYSWAWLVSARVLIWFPLGSLSLIGMRLGWAVYWANASKLSQSIDGIWIFTRGEITYKGLEYSIGQSLTYVGALLVLVMLVNAATALRQWV